MPAVARAQLQGRGRRGGRVRRAAGLGDGLRGHHGGVQTDLGAARPQLSEQDCRAGKSHERSRRGLDLEEVETEIAAAHGSGRGRDLHGAGGLSWGVSVEFDRRDAEAQSLATEV